MSKPENREQQIEEMISDFCEDAIRYGEELHTGRVKSDEEIKADSVELLQKQTEILEAIDRLVTEARIDELENGMFINTNLPSILTGYIHHRLTIFRKELDREEPISE